MSSSALDLLETLTTFLLGLAVLCGAAFVLFGRSRSGAAFVALAGLSFVVGTPLEYVLRNGHVAALQSVWLQLLMLVEIGRHVVFFGGLALAFRALALDRRVA